MDSLGITAVIATILSAVFAAAALWNSIARKRHEAMMARALDPEEEKIKFRPPPSSPSATAHPGAIRHPSPVPGPKLFDTSSDKKKQADPSPPTPLFRQIRPTGEVKSELFSENEELYVWE